MLKRLKRFFIESEHTKRDSYIWNMLSAFLFSTQSAIMLIAITHTNGLSDAGMFSIAYAIGSLTYYIGEYGVRKYQVSDIKEDLTFTDYHSHRVITCIIAVAISIAYVLYDYLFQTHSLKKAYVILAVCLIKVIEAYSEVYFARYQQVGRLDVAAKTNFFRTAIGMLCCLITLIITHNLVISMSIWFLSVLIAMYLSSILVYKDFGEIHVIYNWDSIKKIFKECAPLFAGYFLLLYTSNAPKYAIDTYMTDVDQAHYNFIFMPVFAVGLLANFIFNPILVSLAYNWENKQIRSFTSIIIKQVLIIVAITVFAVVVAMTIGPMILGIMYNANIAPFRVDLIILMIGGGALALVNFFSVIITMLRCQKNLIIGYVAVTICSMVLSNEVVKTYGIRGASVLYTFLMLALVIVLTIITATIISRKS